MAAGTEVNTVWIGFMDIFPVIGTVKEAVELVLALYEGNKAVIKEKEKAVEDIVKESFKKHVKKLTLPDKPAAGAAAASEFSGLKNVKEVKKEMLIECVGKGSKRGPHPTPAQQQERQRKLEDIKNSMLQRISAISPNFKFNQELKEELQRPRRGEHVFNNGILRFHSDVLINFIQHNRIDHLQGYNQQVMNELGRHTLQQNTANEIQNEMVVHFAADEFYVNANAIMYSEYCQNLRVALLAVLNHINLGDVEEAETQRVNFVINNMNNLAIYVDQLAREKWIGNRQDRQTRFDNVRHEVVTMYSTDRGLDWCYDILDKVAPLFGDRQ